jgi:hypothetical protein
MERILKKQDLNFGIAAGGFNAERHSFEIALKNRSKIFHGFFQPLPFSFS